MGGAEGVGVSVASCGAEDEDAKGFRDMFPIEYTSIGSCAAIVLSPCAFGGEFGGANP